jgi:hypothetical protein
VNARPSTGVSEPSILGQPDARTVIDATWTPHLCDHTGREDCTAILSVASNMGGHGFLLTEDSSITARFATNGWKVGDTNPAIAVEQQGDLVRKHPVGRLPKRIVFHPDDPSGTSRQLQYPSLRQPSAGNENHALIVSLVTLLQWPDLCVDWLRQLRE